MENKINENIAYKLHFMPFKFKSISRNIYLF